MNLGIDEAAVKALGERLRAKGQWLATAESCTGGLIAAACTAVAGSSEWFERGFVTYSNDAKTQLLGVDPALIARHGAVSEPVVRAMAEGALGRAPVQWSVAVTGIAGPGGGSAAKPVGTVWLAVGRVGEGVRPTVHAECVRFEGDRTAVRTQTVARAFALLDRALEADDPGAGGVPGAAAGSAA